MKETFTWQEINPEGFTEVINGKTLKFGIYTIADSIYFEDKYGALSIKEMLERHPTAFIYEVAWRILEDKTYYPTFESFTKDIKPQDANKMELANKVLKVLGLCLEKKMVEEEEETPSKGNGFRWFWQRGKTK